MLFYHIRELSKFFIRLDKINLFQSKRSGYVGGRPHNTIVEAAWTTKNQAANPSLKFSPAGWFLAIIFSSVFSFSEVIVLDRDLFLVDDKEISLKGKRYVVVDMHEGVGKIFVFNKNGKLLKKIDATGGPYIYRTPSKMYRVLEKKKYHMSKDYPDPDGVNNMDDMLRLTWSGIALHKGSTNYFSHGCIHVDPKRSRELFDWARIGDIVLVTEDKFAERVGLD